MEPYIGEIRLFSFNFQPEGWLLCNGESVSINSYTALYSLLGETFGPASHTNFTLPDFRGRVPIHQGQRPGFQKYNLGTKAGEIYVNITAKNIQNHKHELMAFSEEANTDVPSGAFLANARSNTYASPQMTPSPELDATLNKDSVARYGNDDLMVNMQPFLTMNYYIAYEGVFPQRP